VNPRGAAALREIARRYRGLGNIKSDPELQSEGATQLALEFLEALGGYELTTHFLAFATGPLQQMFVRTYEDEIRMDADRTVLRLYDDPETRKRAVMMAATTGRIIELDPEGENWQFRPARDQVDMVQWLHAERAGPGESAVPIHLPSAGQGGPMRYHAEHTHEAPQEKEEAGGQYL